MSFQVIYDFLNELTSHNDRDWFQRNKEKFRSAQTNFKEFIISLQNEMMAHDELEETGTKVYRIYRDVRFSNDKTPYKTFMSGSFKRATEEKRGGYYISIRPKGSFLAGGFFGPNAQDLLHIRKQISQNPEELQDILNTAEIQKNFGGLKGDKVKTAPRGFSKEDPALPLIRHKQYILQHDIPDDIVLGGNLDQHASSVFASMRPFLDYMSDILTTDLNGVPLLGGSHTS